MFGNQTAEVLENSGLNIPTPSLEECIHFHSWPETSYIFVETQTYATEMSKKMKGFIQKQ